MKRINEMKRMFNVFSMMSLMLLLGCSGLTGLDHNNPLKEAIRATAKTLTPLNYSRYGKPPVPVNVLIMIPYEFESYEYVSTNQGKEIRHRLGLNAKSELREAFGVEFASSDLWEISSKDKASAMLFSSHPENVDVRKFDYAAIPQFTKVVFSTENDKYGFNLELEVAFHGRDGSIITIKGQGETIVEKYSSTTPEQSSVLTLQYAVSAILDEIEKRRNFFK